MKKLMLLGMVVLAVVLCLGVTKKVDEGKVASFDNEQLVKVYLIEEDRNDYDELVIDDFEDGMIHYHTYMDGKLTNLGSINRDYYNSIYTRR